MTGWMMGAVALLSASAAQVEARPELAPLRPGWLAFGLPGGAELRYVPLSVTPKDYPKEARKADAEGTSVVSLEVDSSGRLKGCTIAKSSGSPALDEQACTLYRKRGRFELRGTSEPVTVQAPVRWVLLD